MLFKMPGENTGPGRIGSQLYLHVPVANHNSYRSFVRLRPCLAQRRRWLEKWAEARRLTV